MQHLKAGTGGQQRRRMTVMQLVMGELTAHHATQQALTVLLRGAGQIHLGSTSCNPCSCHIANRVQDNGLHSNLMLISTPQSVLAACTA